MQATVDKSWFASGPSAWQAILPIGLSTQTALIVFTAHIPLVRDMLSILCGPHVNVIVSIENNFQYRKNVLCKFKASRHSDSVDSSAA